MSLIHRALSLSTGMILLLRTASSLTAPQHVGRRTLGSAIFQSSSSRRSRQRHAVSADAAAFSYTTHSSFHDDIIDRYDAFILDQFGVLHNGQTALPGAVALVEHLARTKDKKLIILSNTSAPADKTLLKLPKLGFDDTLFAGGAVTSGEEASRYIFDTFGSSTTSITKKILMLTWDASDATNPRLTAYPDMFLAQCGNVALATTVGEADVLLFHGSEVWYKGTTTAQSLSPFLEMGDFRNVDSILKACQERNLPAVCANPDFVVQIPSGEGVNYMPGKLAARYEELGGTCRTFGKPGAEHFEACISKLGLDKQRVCHVGDSLHHDIAGACQAGVPSVFVTSGIHKAELGTEFGELPTNEALQKLLQDECEEKVRPTHVVPAFRL